MCEYVCRLCVIIQSSAVPIRHFALSDLQAPAGSVQWVEGRYSGLSLVPIRFGNTVHLYIQLAPHIKKVEGDVFVLVSAYVTEFPGDGTQSYFRSDGMDEVVVELTGCIVVMLEYGC